MRRTILPTLLIVFFVVFSLWPTVYEWQNQHELKPERYFELVHNFYTDYNFYLSRIRQGREGGRLVKEKYTSEPHSGSLVQIFYLAIGWVADWTRTPWPRSGDAYQMARIVLAITQVSLVYWFVRQTIKQFWWQIIAFLLALTASTWPILVFHNGGWRFGGYMPWWSVMDSLQRITFVPHMLAGQALIIFLLAALSSGSVLQRPGNWIFLGFLGLVLGFVFPPGLMFLYAGLVFVVGFEYIFYAPYRDRKSLQRWLVYGVGSRVLFSLISLPSLVYLQLVLSVYPWKRLIDYALLGLTPFNLVEYVKAMGPVLPLGIFGFVVAVRKKEKDLLAPVSWVAAWLALILIFKYIPQESPLRFTEMAPHIPLALLSAYGFGKLYRWAKKPVWQSVWIATPLVVIVVGLWVMYSSWLWQKDFVDHKIRSDFPLVPTGSYVMYPLKDFVSAMIFIQDHTSRDTVILSGKTAGNYMPVYSGNTVYIGHAGTVRAEEKEKIVKEFFSGRMAPKLAKDWLDREDLRYVFFGPEEWEMEGIRDLRQVYPFLSELYKGAYVAVYEVL